MNVPQNLKDQLKRLDYNNDGKITVADATAVLAAHIEGLSPVRVALSGFAAGAITATFLIAVFVK